MAIVTPFVQVGTSRSSPTFEGAQTIPSTRRAPLEVFCRPFLAEQVQTVHLVVLNHVFIGIHFLLFFVIANNCCKQLLKGTSDRRVAQASMLAPLLSDQSLRGQSKTTHCWADSDDFPRDCPLQNIRRIFGREGFPDMSRFFSAFSRMRGAISYPTRNFATLGPL